MKNLNSVVAELERKFGSAGLVMQRVNLKVAAANCSGSHCEYAIGDEDCSGCKGAMFG